MPTPSHRPLTRALKAVVVFAVLAAIVVVTGPSGRSHPPEQVVTAPVSTVPRYMGPTVDRGHELAAAIERAQLDAFYTWAAAQPPPTTTPTTKSTKSSKSTKPSAAQAPSGDALEAIAAHFGDLYDEAVRVAGCESGLDPASGPSPTGDYGLFQLHRAAHRGSFEAVTGVPFDDGWSNADLNARFARWLYDQSGGWGPWSCRWAAA